MVTRYPGSPIVSVRQAMDRLVNEAFSPAQFGTIWPAQVADRERTLLPIDAYATNDEVVILAAAPGISANDLDISVEKNTLTITGTVPSVAKSEQAKGATWYLHELPRGSFRRSLTLPLDVDASKAEATFENGVLRLVLPKAESAKPRHIPVQAASPAQESPAITGTVDEE
jgi:HSP20 family molecular chaperone IbpA